MANRSLKILRHDLTVGRLKNAAAADTDTTLVDRASGFKYRRKVARKQTTRARMREINAPRTLPVYVDAVLSFLAPQLWSATRLYPDPDSGSRRRCQCAQ